MQKLPDFGAAVSHHRKPLTRDGSQFTGMRYHPRMDGGIPFDAPLKRNKSVLIVAPLSGFEICSYGARFPSAQDGRSAFGAPFVTQGKQEKEVAPYKDKERV